MEYVSIECIANELAKAASAVPGASVSGISFGKKDGKWSIGLSLKNGDAEIRYLVQDLKKNDCQET